MNDETNGQLTSTWAIPPYARSALYLQTESECVPVEGEHGLFELSVPAQELTLRWYGEEGPALAYFRWQPDSLGWDGLVAVGGYIDSMHFTTIGERTMQLIFLGGHPLNRDIAPYPSAADRARVPYPVPDFHHALVAAIPESVSTWLIDEHSALAHLVRDGLMNSMRLHLFGRLAEENTLWAKQTALPLMLESATLFTT